MSTMPSEYFVTSWETQYQTDKVTADTFTMANLTAYDQAFTIDLEYGTSESYDMGLASGHKIEFQWVYGYPGGAQISVRHTWPGPFGWWTEFELLRIQPPYVYDIEYSDYPIALVKADVITNLWENKITNATFAEWAVGGYRANTFISTNNASWTIEESWDNQWLNITTSYEVDYNATQINAFNLLSQILFFQAPSLGLGVGVHATIFNAVIAIPIWIMIAILAIKLIQSIIPFITGIDD